MIPPAEASLARATAIAKRDQLRPLPCTRRDTGELICLVQSRSDPSRHYVLTVSNETIQCPCPQAHHRGICAHAAAVRLALQAKPPLPPASTSSDQPVSLSDPRHALRSESQQGQAQRQHAEVERRERAPLWTDDRPFSVWKS